MPLRGGEVQRQLVQLVQPAHAKCTVKVQLIYPGVNAFVKPQMLRRGIKPKEESRTLCPDSPIAHLKLHLIRQASPASETRTQARLPRPTDC